MINLSGRELYYLPSILSQYCIHMKLQTASCSTCLDSWLLEYIRLTAQADIWIPKPLFIWALVYTYSTPWVQACEEICKVRHFFHVHSTPLCHFILILSSSFSYCRFCSMDVILQFLPMIYCHHWLSWYQNLRVRYNWTSTSIQQLHNYTIKKELLKQWYHNKDDIRRNIMMHSISTAHGSLAYFEILN